MDISGPAPKCMRCGETFQWHPSASAPGGLRVSCRCTTERQVMTPSTLAEEMAYVSQLQQHASEQWARFLASLHEQEREVAVRAKRLHEEFCDWSTRAASAMTTADADLAVDWLRENTDDAIYHWIAVRRWYVKFVERDTSGRTLLSARIDSDTKKTKEE